MSEHVAPSHSCVGILTSTPHDGGPAVVRDIVRCVHCDYRWVWQPGSGRRRGFCTKCNGLVCGHAHCAQVGCHYWRNWIDNVSAGRPEYATPAMASVPSLSNILTG